ATPHVAGLAALLRAQDTTRTWSQLRNLIVTGADKKPSLAGRTVTGRRINAFGSATCLRKGFFGVLRPLETQPGQPIPIALRKAKTYNRPAVSSGARLLEPPMYRRPFTIVGDEFTIGSFVRKLQIWLHTNCPQEPARHASTSPFILPA